MIPILLIAAIVFEIPTLYFAVKSRDFRKKFGGCVLVSAGMQIYFYVANVSIPLMGTSIIQAPGISAVEAPRLFLRIQ